MEDLLKDLAIAEIAIRDATNYPKLLEVTEYADLTATLEFICSIQKRLHAVNNPH